MSDPVPKTGLNDGQVGSDRTEDLYVFCGSQI
jgi:hypothetical protein